MAIVKLQILEPADGANFLGSAGIRLRGAVLPPDPGAPLFFKWYSSLAASPLGTALDFAAPLRVGSHIVSFTAKDVEGDAVPDLQSVKHGGMAGGPEKAEHPCRIHVYLANIVEPALPGAPLSIASGPLAAEAPSQWESLDYQAVNRIRFRWRFTGAVSAEFLPPLTFDASGSLPVVRYAGPLPSGLTPGNFTLTLRVEDVSNPAIGHEVSRAVVLTA